MRLTSLAPALLLILAGCGGEPPARTDAPAVPDAKATATAPVATPAAAPSVTAAPTAPASAPTVVYRWDAQEYLKTTGPYTATALPGADGSQRVQIAAGGGDWNNLIKVPVGVLKGDHEYLATLSYEIVKPPPYPGNPFPGTFHLYARSAKLGQENDVWQNWLGDAGDKGVVRLPLRLRPADDWTFTVGCKGAGTLIVDSLTITEGTGFVFTPATADAAAAPVASAAAVVTGCAAVTLTPPATGTGLEVSAHEFGLTADPADGTFSDEVAAANATALAKAVDSARTRNASRLVIPAGVYHVAQKESLKLENLHDLTLDGQGGMLIFCKLLKAGPAIDIKTCQRVVIRDLRIDWDWKVNPIASLCVVQAMADDRKSATIQFPDLDAATTERVKTANWAGFNAVDPETMLPTGIAAIKPLVVSRESKGGNVLAVAFSTPQKLVVGQSYVIRHLYYEMGTFKMTDVSNLRFQGVTIHSLPGMGWVGRGDLDHLALVDCHLAPPPGSRRPMTTAADGFHIIESQGSILIENCSISRTGDDCINIHDNCFQGLRQTGPNTLVLVGNHRWNMKVAAGDKLELFHQDYSPTGFSGTVKAVNFKKDDTELEFTDPLPAGISPLSIVFNRRYGTNNVRIVNSRFSFGRVLVSAQHVTIEGNEFDHPFANAIQLHTEIVGSLWAEGSGAGDVVIRNNRFTGANLRGKFGGAVIYGAPVLPAGRTQFPLFHDVLITGNQFADSRGPVVSLGACKNVEISGNRITGDNLLPNANAQAGVILAECGSALRITDNTWTPGPAQKLPGVLIDPATTSGVVIGGNRVAGK